MAEHNRDGVPPPALAPTSSSNNNNSIEMNMLANLDDAQKQMVVAGLFGQQIAMAPALMNGGTSPRNMTEIDYTNIIQTIQALGTNASLPNLGALSFLLEQPTNIPQQVIDGTLSSASSTPSSTTTAISNSVQTIAKPTPAHEPEYKPRNVREKVYAEGYIMSFDKKSCCGTRHFWRCERKNDCNARMHSDIDTREIVRRLHPHNHEKPSPEELAFYEQDFSILDSNHCHPVKSINRSYMQRKLSRASRVAPVQPSQASKKVVPEKIEIGAASQSLQQMQQNNNLMLLASINAAAASATAPISSPAVDQNTTSTTVMSTEMISPIVIKQEDEDCVTPEEFRSAQHITRQIIDIMNPKRELGVKWQGDEQALLLFLSHDNGADENVFLPVVVMSRDERSLIAALEGFTGKRCEGNIVICCSQRVNVLVHEALIGNWPHGKLFLVNSDAAALWRLTPVDAFGAPLNHS